MGKLTQAIDILTNLNAHIENETTSATKKATAEPKDFAGAITLLDAEIAYADNQKAEALELKRTKGSFHGRNKMPQLTALEETTQLLYVGMTDLKTKYTADAAAEQVRIEAERVEAERVEAARVEAERADADRKETARLKALAEKKRLEEKRLAAERAELERIAALSQPEANTPAADETVTVAETVVDEAVAVVDEELAYTIALGKLKTTMDALPSLNIEEEHVKTALGLLITDVENAKQNPKLLSEVSDLIEILESTQLRLDPKATPEAISAYEEKALTMQGKPNPAKQNLGILMIALSVALVALAIVFAPAAIAAVVALSSPVAYIAASAGAAVGAVATVGLAAKGFGIFADGYKQHGISARMSELNKAKIAQDAIIPAEEAKSEESFSMV